MLEDVIKTKKVCGKSVSLLLYSIDREYQEHEDNHTHFYEIRISDNDKRDSFGTYAENYLKKESLKLFNDACKHVENEVRKEVISELITNKDYEENIKEILEKYFTANPHSLKEWADWFNGEKMEV